jgi:Cd(II)/Pb(II)-responsive transcriptional regulator
MRIGELAQKAGTQPETVRYYERLGILPDPSRTPANYRDYDGSHLERLLFIRNCRAVGMALDDVRRLLHFRDRPELACHEINGLLDKHIMRVDEQVADLLRLADDLRRLRACCESPRTAGDCGILAHLNSVGSRTPR